MKESLPDLERASIIQVSTQQVSNQEPNGRDLDTVLILEQAVGVSTAKPFSFRESGSTLAPALSCLNNLLPWGRKQN